MDFALIAEHVQAIAAWFWANKEEILVGLLALSGAVTQLSALTPWTWDDEMALGLGRVLNVLAGFYGKNRPAEPKQ